MERQETEYDITLSSLGGGEKYSQINAISDFTNPLSTQLRLNGQWEVAIKKVSYHNNIINVNPGQNQIVFKGYRYTDICFKFCSYSCTCVSHAGRL